MKHKNKSFFAARLSLLLLLAIFALTVLRLAARSMILFFDTEIPFGNVMFFDNKPLQFPDSKIMQIEAPIEPLPDFVKWAERYPFSDENSAEEDVLYNEEIADSDKISEAKTKNIKLELKPLSRVALKIQNWVKTNFIFRNTLISCSSIVNSFLKWNVKVTVDNSGIVKLPNGHFTEFIPKGDVTEKVKSLVEFNEFLRLKNIPFLFVLAPYKADPSDKALSGVLDFSNQNADEFLQALGENNISFIDMREEIAKTQKDFYSFFYRTDHHWTSEAGLFATKKIAQKLNDFGIEIDASIYDNENFTCTVFEKSFMGSRGRAKRLPHKYMEDITLIEPKQNYSIEARISSSREIIREASGGFETLIFKEHLQSIDNMYTDNAYAIYVNGDTIIELTNHSAKNKIRVLILGDSFTDVVEPFLALGVHTLDALDLRHFTGSLERWINSHEKYDICIMLSNTSSVTGGINKESHKDLWDFR